jgi:LmbE family N-acetylglucosaminyl deacetylase
MDHNNQYMQASLEIPTLLGATAARGAQRIAVVVAHPDDETLWAGGLMLANPGQDWVVLSLCRAGDADRAPRFERVLQVLNARGRMLDLDDSPEQAPLVGRLVEQAVLDGLAGLEFDLIVTHGGQGEYTFHRRHVEASQAVTRLWRRAELSSPRLWQFAYADEGQGALPRAQASADLFLPLPEPVWLAKYHLITDVYGFTPESWEARATPREEAFLTLKHDRGGN